MVTDLHVQQFGSIFCFLGDGFRVAVFFICLRLLVLAIGGMSLSSPLQTHSTFSKLFRKAPFSKIVKKEFSMNAQNIHYEFIEPIIGNYNLLPNYIVFKCALSMMRV